ncbi:hypothetical protein BCV70DRAFT_94709 [Testicularia cyperi]|uniref:Uncharacterized protein n=1 Tax=Testicularia cyperi TaxID=1882483 RepID=A0A317XRG8_9BASI|nr:hypothetical protein BCV70DRAFT_94709 [Testicularia cyperi]
MEPSQKQPTLPPRQCPPRPPRMHHLRRHSEPRHPHLEAEEHVTSPPRQIQRRPRRPSRAIRWSTANRASPQRRRTRSDLPTPPTRLHRLHRRRRLLGLQLCSTRPLAGPDAVPRTRQSLAPRPPPLIPLLLRLLPRLSDNPLPLLGRTLAEYCHHFPGLYSTVSVLHLFMLSHFFIPKREFCLFLSLHVASAESALCLINVTLYIAIL